jgi:hypothetical protein
MVETVLVIVSDEDFEAHQNANELINRESYPSWRKPHHECSFVLKPGDNDPNQQMRMVIHSHYAYSL